MKEFCLKYGVVVCPKTKPTRQMLLSTNNQDKEAPGEGLPPTAPDLPGAPSLYPNVSIWAHPLHKSQLQYVP